MRTAYCCTMRPPAAGSGAIALLIHSSLSPSLPNAQDHAHRMLLHGVSRKFWAARGRRVLPPPVNAKVERLIQDWFRLVDTDESGTLDIAELESALKVSQRT